MSAEQVTPALFRPIRIGDIELSHRVVLAPLTRARATAEHVPTEPMTEYYRHRSCVPGTLLISEATIIAPSAGGFPHAPGIWNNAQIEAWKKITDAVHKSGSYIYMQLWAMGRAARPQYLKTEDPAFEPVAPSPIASKDHPENVPRALTKEEIKQYVRWFAEGAANAVHKAGFDGVEVHGANGYLIDQFIQDVTNKRTDDYGGSIENRARFALEVMEAVVAAVGQSKAAIRLSPWNVYGDMRMEDPIPTFSYIVTQLKERFPDLAFLHVVSHATKFNLNIPPEDLSTANFIHDLWKPRPVIITGEHTRESGLKTAEETGQLIGYGALFLANPDLPFRLRENLELNVPDPTTYYTFMDPKGYNTYSFSPQFLSRHPEWKASIMRPDRRWNLYEPSRSVRG